jgi:SSS family solute:Na+ symporter
LLYFGIFSKFGNSQGAIGGMLGGIATVCALQIAWPVGAPWAYGLTTGAIGLLVNLAVFISMGLLVERTHEELARLDALFSRTAERPADEPEAVPSFIS